MMRVPSIPFSVRFVCRSGCRLSTVRCLVYGVLVARVAERKPTACFARVYFFAVFVISSIPMPSSRLGPTDKYDGDAQTRRRVLLARSNLALPCACSLSASSFAVLKSIVFIQRLKGAEVRLEFSAPFLQYRPLVRPFLPFAAWQLSSGISSLVCRVGNQEGGKKDSCVPQCRSQQAAASICVPHDFCHSQRSVQIRLQRTCSSRCRLSRPSTQLPTQRHEPVPCVQVLFRAVAQVPVCLPKTFHLFLCGFLVQKPDCNAMPAIASCVVSLGCAVQAEERLSRFPPAVDPECPVCVSCRFSRNMSNLDFAFSTELSTAFENSTRLSSLLQAICDRLQVPSDPRTCCRCLPSPRLQSVSRCPQDWHVVSWESSRDEL